MKKIILLRRARSTSANTGVDTYSNNIADLLEKNSMEYSEIGMILDLKKGIMHTIANGFIRPFFEVIKNRKDTDVFHATDDFCCLFFPLMNKSRKIVTFHHVINDDEKDTRFLFIWKLIAKIGIIWADDIIAISSQTKSEIMNKYKIDDSKITVISNSISKKFITLDVPNKKYIGCVTTLIARKNVHSLLRVFKLFKEMENTEEYTLKICGYGPEKESLIQTSKDLGIFDCVEFVSGLTDEEIILFYNEASVIATPSIHEGFGYTALESQLCSTPVVYFETSSVPEEVVRCAIPSKDEKDFAKNLHDLISDRKLYEDTVRRGNEYAKKFTAEQDNVLNLYLKED